MLSVMPDTGPPGSASGTCSAGMSVMAGRDVRVESRKARRLRDLGGIRKQQQPVGFVGARRIG